MSICSARLRKHL